MGKRGVEDLSSITAAILAGGQGTRLQSVVVDCPKVLAEVGGRPFLSYLLDQVVEAGVREVVLCTGYRADQVREAFGDKYGSLRLFYSEEDVQLGTAGALRHASSLLKSESVLVMNGDSFVDADLRDFWIWHCALGADATVMVVKVQDSGRYGLVQMDVGGHLIGFTEKGEKHEPGWINAGIYLLRHAFLDRITAVGVVSLERDVFPTCIGQGLYAYQNHGGFLDIGTPEAYASAESFFAGLAKKRFVLLDRDGT
jgi:NDP-sugar pyrophosphorylase family protein